MVTTRSILWETQPAKKRAQGDAGSRANYFTEQVTVSNLVNKRLERNALSVLHSANLLVICTQEGARGGKEGRGIFAIEYSHGKICSHTQRQWKPVHPAHSMTATATVTPRSPSLTTAMIAS
ncbi:hypothetical protein L3X38_004243 [Prunus dulcis]|uniref:Uncharacterized protein n=1 Tax=Prunus dulcis TaxID=3755 RepID=A0AAD4ZNI2_PRUDU|nr:hypothetical protein L3X38_004243 [Prunus dulcis]